MTETNLPTTKIEASDGPVGPKVIQNSPTMESPGGDTDQRKKANSKL